MSDNIVRFENEYIMRLISTLNKAAAETTAKVYHDTEWNEYCVKFYRQGHHLIAADYHTDDKEDALDTARTQLQSMSETETN